MLKRSFVFLIMICFYGTGTLAQDPVVTFVLNNPDKAALYIIKNDTAHVKLNENKLMPLASTVKLIVAIEFAKQAGAKVIDTSRYVAISDLDKHFLPLTDGGAHVAWKKQLENDGLIKSDSVRLIDVARGMIIFSSNANMDYLLELLGVQNVNSNLKLFNLKEHTPIYPIVAALFYYQNPKEKKEDIILKSIAKMSNNDYARYAYTMHKALIADGKLKASFRPVDVTASMQKMWSDRLPASTVKSYAQLANILNKRAYLSKDAYGVLQRITESIMENPNNATFLKHAGMKGGSTSFVLTKCMYATTLDGTRYEVALFLNNITYKEVNKLAAALNNFEYTLLTDPDFLESVKYLLKKD